MDSHSDDQQHSALTFNDGNFAQEVKEFPGVVVVDFWATWCAPCRAIAPIVEDMAKKYNTGTQIKVGKLDTDSNPGVSMEFNVMSIPTVKVFANGQLVDELNGFMGPATAVMLEDKVKKALERVEVTAPNSLPAAA